MSEEELIRNREKLTDVDELPERLQAEVVKYTKNAPKELHKFYPNVFKNDN